MDETRRVVRVEPVARAGAVAAVVAAIVVGVEVGSDAPRPWQAAVLVTMLVAVGSSAALDPAARLVARRGRPDPESPAAVVPDRVGWRLGLLATGLPVVAVVGLLELLGLEGPVAFVPGVLVAAAVWQHRRTIVSRSAERGGVAVCSPIPGWLPRRLGLGPAGPSGATLASSPLRTPAQLGDGRRSPPRAVRSALGVVLLALAVPSWSLGTTLARPSSDPLSIRAVEWFRAHGGAGTVNGIESWWYRHHQPKTGGTPTAPLAGPAPPGSGLTPTGPTAVPPLGLTPTGLAAVPALASPPLPGEGQWRAVSGPAARPAVAVTQLRPDPVHTSLLAGVLRVDPSQVRLQLLAGTDQPGGSFPENGQVPIDERPRLLAAFNSGFRQHESAGGYFAEGRVVAPLVDGAASLVIFSNGTATVGQWGRDAQMSSDVTAVRQNLSLIVDNRTPVDGLDANLHGRWGHTLGNRLFVWRSGLGVTGDGALVYVAGPGLSVSSLATLLVDAGSIRAMELDINTDWVGAFTYQPAAAGPVGTKLLAGMFHDPTRYLHPQSRDFVAVLARP